MKTRRIHLQPDECIELINQYGTPILKAHARFSGEQACVVIYEQPDVLVIPSSEARAYQLTSKPVVYSGAFQRPRSISPDLVEQNEFPQIDVSYLDLNL